MASNFLQQCLTPECVVDAFGDDDEVAGCDDADDDEVGLVVDDLFARILTLMS